MRSRVLSHYFKLGRFFHGDTPVSGAISLGRRNIYILPTRDGLFFAVVLILMLIGSINYSNSLGYLLCFLLASLAVVSILHTYKNLYRLELNMGEIKPVFCGQMLHIPLLINNLNGPLRTALYFKLQHGETLALLDIDANTSSTFVLKYKTRHRGRLKLEGLRISSRFPLGLFQAWSILNFSRHALVYPRPANHDRQAPEQIPASYNEGEQGLGDDDFSGLRNYQPGDTLHHIHWKALAKKQGLLSKQFGANDLPQQWFDWRSLAPLDTEARLCQLTRWIIEAQKNGTAYGLWLPGNRIVPANSHAHQHRCLRLLAEFRQPDFTLSESALHG